MRILLKTKEKTKHLTTLSFFKNTIDLDHTNRDTIIELSLLDHPPTFKAHLDYLTTYKIKSDRKESPIVIPLLKATSVVLKRLWIGDHWLMADNDTLFKIRVIPPLTLENKEHKDHTLLSKKNKSSDSLSIVIRYTERVDRIQWYAGGEININIHNNQFSCTHKTKNPKRKSYNFKGIDTGILDAVLDLEIKGKATPQCLSTNEDGSFIWLTINGQKTSFEFCTKDWDGLQEFIDKIVAMKTS